VDNLKDIENISKDWKLSVQERRDLYKTCARILDENNEAKGAFNTTLAYLRLFESSN